MDTLLMQINLFHQYYEDGVMQNIRLQPDPKTQAFFERYRLIAKQTQGIYTLHYFGRNTAEAFCQTLNNLLMGQPFVFNMISDKASFSVITDLPIDWYGQLQFSSKSYVEKNENLEMTMQLSAKTTVLDSMVGQITIFSENLLTTEGKMRCPLFVIKMKARLTHWHYYVINRSQLKLNNLVVKNSQGIEFESPVPVTLKNGEQALLFSSGERTFALSETFKTPFNLLNLMSNTSEQAFPSTSSVKQLVAGLPIPKTDVLSIEMQHGHHYVYSPMYVYI